MPAKGPGGRKHSFKFKAGDDVRGALVTVDIISLRIKDFTARGDDDRPGLNGQFLFFVLKIDGLCRTEFFTDLTSPFGKKDTMNRINGILQGNCLGILYMDGLSLGKPCIIFTIDLGGAFLSTEAAGNTLRRVNIAWILNHLHFKISLLSGNAFYFRESE
jgi:hypothetical protein